MHQRRKLRGTRAGEKLLLREARERPDDTHNDDFVFAAEVGPQRKQKFVNVPQGMRSA